MTTASDGLSEVSLRERSAIFADELQSTLRACLPGTINVLSTAAPGREDRFLIRPAGDTAAAQRIPLYVGNEQLATLSLAFYLQMDRHGRFLKTIRTDLAIHSTLDRTPLVRLDFRSDMTKDPISHWQIHAERGSMSHLLARAHAVRPELVKKPHDISSLHLATGGERFRPCLEDFLQFVIDDCGVDSVHGWEKAIIEGRERWRRRQVRTVARDAQHEVAGVLAAEGWTVIPPQGSVDENSRIFTTW